MQVSHGALSGWMCIFDVAGANRAGDRGRWVDVWREHKCMLSHNYWFADILDQNLERIQALHPTCAHFFHNAKTPQLPRHKQLKNVSFNSKHRREGKMTCSKFWGSYSLPNAKLCRFGRVTPARLWLNQCPKVKL